MADKHFLKYELCIPRQIGIVGCHSLIRTVNSCYNKILLYFVRHCITDVFYLNN